jgi:hypothetical protein
MLCFEIAINGQQVCPAGNPLDRRISIDVYRNRNESSANIFVAGDSYKDNDWSERFIWGNQRLNTGDHILIKVVEADQPDLPIETHTIKATEESQKLTDSIVKQVAVLWLDQLLRGEPLPFPALSEAHSSIAEKSEIRFCEFCGKKQNEVQKLISSPGLICICNECVGVCVDILGDPAKAAESQSTTAPVARWPTR